MNFVARDEHGGNLYAAVRKSGGELESYLDYSANINPLGLPASVRQAMLSEIDRTIHYPDADAAAFKAAVSEFYRVPVEMITAGNGAVELLYVLNHVLRPDHILVPAPTFSEYERAARAARAEVAYFYLDEAQNFKIPVREFCAAMKTAQIVFIANPNNPTGVLLTKDELKFILTQARENDIIVVVDESFIDFLLEDSSYTCRSLLAEFENLVILHSLTKFYAIPGLRLGFMLANPRLTSCLHLAKDPWNVNSIAQAAGVAALGDTVYRENSRKMMAEAGTCFYREISAISGYKPYKPSVNYMLLNIAASGLTSAEFCQRLFAVKMLARDCSNYPGLSSDYIRLAIKLPEQNQRMLTALKQIIGV